MPVSKERIEKLIENINKDKATLVKELNEIAPKELKLHYACGIELCPPFGVPTIWGKNMSHYIELHHSDGIKKYFFRSKNLQHYIHDFFSLEKSSWDQEEAQNCQRIAFKAASWLAQQQVLLNLSQSKSTSNTLQPLRDNMQTLLTELSGQMDQHAKEVFSFEPLEYQQVHDYIYNAHQWLYEAKNTPGRSVKTFYERPLLEETRHYLDTSRKNTQGDKITR